MGFFRDILRKANGQPTDSEITSAIAGIRDQVHSLQALALAMDAANDSADDISLFACLRFDLLCFSLHIAQSDNMLESSEVDAINMFLGMDISFDDAKAMIEEVGLGDVAFNRTIPASFQILTELASGADVGSRKFAEAMINTYQNLGRVISLVDGSVDEREIRDLDNYINMLRRYTSTF